MDRHLTHRALARLFSGIASHPGAQTAVAHLRSCRRCWQLAATVIVELRKEGALNPADTVGAAVLSLIEEELQHVVEKLGARSWWADMRDESPGKQMERIKSIAALQTLSFFEAVLEDSEKIGLEDPLRGEQGALLARDVAGVLPGRRCPEDLRCDLQGDAMTVVANCRRLASDWRGSLTAIAEAREYLRHGSGEPRRQARLLSIHASLASDTANMDLALDLLSRAAAIYRQEGDADGLAATAVKEASALLAGGKAEEAMARAEEVLELGAAVSCRLQMLAKSVVTESLIELNRPAEALLSYSDTRPLYDQFSTYDLRVAKLEGRLLDCLGHAREAEKMLRQVARGNMEAEHYKEAFLTLYVLVEAFCKRGALEKAAKICEEAIEMLEVVGSASHAQMKEVWQDLLEMVRRGSVSAFQVLAVRHYLARYWCVPAPHSPFSSVPEPSAAPVSAPLLKPVQVLAEEAIPMFAEVERPPIPAELSSESYTDALERLDRDLVAAALAQSQGSIRGTTRLLRISRTTLRAKMKKYGLAAAAGD
jgi:tetratricopeptide (TPR) repeat protein